MRARVLTIANPFAPYDRKLVELRRPRSIRSLAPRTDAPHIAVLNGKPILRQAWRRKLRHGDQLCFTVLPRGHGGGSNPLSILLSLALMAFAPWAVSFLGPAFYTAGVAGAAGALTFLGQATVLGIVFAGNALISALNPQPKVGQIEAPSPTYMIQAQGNAARIGQAIPVQYGRLLTFPDFAAQPYAEFSGNDQYVFELFCLGQGAYDIEAIKIEDTPISAFPEITYQVVQPGEQLTLFPADVTTSVEVSGQELLGETTGTWSRSTTVLTVTETAHGRLPGNAVYLTLTTGTGPTDGAYTIATTPTDDTFTVTVATGSGSGNCTIDTMIGGLVGFVAAAPGSIATTIALDVILPRGLYSAPSSEINEVTLGWKVQARQIDDAGAAIGSWITLGTESLTDRTPTPIRKSYRYDLATPGRYAVRAFRTTAKDNGGTVGNDLLWGALRSYLRDDTEFGNVTLIAMRLLATNSISSLSSRKIAVLSTRKIPVWNGMIWSAPQATSSIAWALADAARNGDYGAGFADSRLDLDALLALDATWTTREDEFNGRFESQGSFWDAAKAIAGAGRAQPFLQGGILRCVRDDAQTIPIALYSMRNIKKGSFGIDYMMSSEDTADAVDLTYFDSTVWQPRHVTAALTGSTAAKPAQLDMTLGITNRPQALREGLYHAATNKYRRRFVGFKTEMEGFIPSIGDLIAIQHDMPGWGQQAEAIGWDASTQTMTLTEDMTFGAGTYYVRLRTNAGGLSDAWQVIAGPSANQIILVDTPDVTPYTGAERERTHVVFGQANTCTIAAKVVSAKPSGLHEITIECVVEDPSVHTAETGITAPPILTSNLPRRVTAPVVSGLIGRTVPGDATHILIAWQPAPNADIYQIECAEGYDVADPTVTWTRAGDTTASQYQIRLIYASRTMIRVRGVGIKEGPWIASALGSLITEFWPLLPTDLFWKPDPSLMWS